MAGRAVGLSMLLLVSSAALAESRRLALDADAGLGVYTGAMGQVVRPGASWGLRATSRLSRLFSVGAFYQGSSNQLDAVDAIVDASPPLLSRNAAGALVRVSPEPWALKPYLEVGAGAALTAPSSGAAGPNFKRAISPVAPVALGLSWEPSVLRVGARVGIGLPAEGNAYRQGSGSLVSASLSLGAQF